MFPSEVKNSAPSPKTLEIMFIIGWLCLPVLIANTVCIYLISRGKVDARPNEL